MDSPDPNDAPTPPEDAAVDRQSRLLAALLAADPDLILLQRNETAAHLLRTTKPLAIVLQTTPEGAAPDALRETLKRLVKAVTPASPPTHLVVIGGGAEVEPEMKRAAPFVQPVPMGFYHLGASGSLEHVTGQRLPLLEQAAASAGATAPLTPEALAQALARGEALVEQERKVALGLKGQPRVTAILAAACVALFGISYLWGSGLHHAALWRMGAESGEAIRRGEIWRLFAAAFLHLDPVHLIVNMIALWSFGSLLEALLGPRRYLVLYGASALGGSLASTLLSSDRWSVGASGAIWGLMTAGIGLALRPKGLLPPLMVAGMRRRVWVPLAINLAYSLRPGVDMLAHLGGGIVGFALTFTVLTDGLTPVEERRDPASAEATPSPLTAALAVIMSAAMAISVVTAVVLGRPWTLGAPPVLTRVAIADTGLSIELPSTITADMVPTEADRVRIFTYGRLNESPLVFQVMVAPLSREVSADELDAFLDQERKSLDEQGPPEAVRAAPARRVTVGPRPGVLIEHDVNEIHLKSFLMVVGAQEVIVRGYAGKGRPAAWQGMEERVAATVGVIP